MVKLYIPPTTSNIKEIKSPQKDIKHHTHEELDKQLFLGKITNQLIFKPRKHSNESQLKHRLEMVSNRLRWA